MENKKLLIIMIIIAVLIITGFIYFRTIYVTKETINENKNISKMTGEIKEFSIIARQFEFSPNIMEVNKGDLIKFYVKSIDVEHGFAIREFGINEFLKPGEEVEIEFIADKQGEFEFSCSIYCGSKHIEMKGKLIVR